MHKDCKYARVTVEKEDGKVLIDSKSGLSQEPLFVFRAQDKLAPIALAAYIEALYAIGDRNEMIEHVERHLEDFREWTPRKMPD